MPQCPVCLNQDQKIENDLSAHVQYIDCIVCGNFSISLLVKSTINDLDSEKRKVLSYALRQKQLDTKCPQVNVKDIGELLETQLPTIEQQVQNVLLLIKNHVNYAGDDFDIDSSKHTYMVGAMNPRFLGQLITKLKNDGLIDGQLSNTLGSNVKGRFSLTIEGWQKCESIINGESQLKSAFMAMDFKNPNIEKVYKEMYKPLCKKYGYDLSTLNKKVGLIDNTLREQIIDSKFLIADLTDDNYGAYWESGFAEGSKVPVIYCCEKSKFEEKKTHFDTNHLLTACWLIDDKDYTIKELEDIIIATFQTNIENKS